MSYKFKIWLTKLPLPHWFGPKCGHYDTCKVKCDRVMMPHVEENPEKWISLQVSE